MIYNQLHKTFSQKRRKAKPDTENFSFMPENSKLRKARDVTLNVLDMLFIGGEREDPRTGNNSRINQNRQIFPNSFGQTNNGGNLVDTYLEQTSLVDCSSATIPLKAKKKIKKKKRNKTRKVNRRIIKQQCYSTLFFQWVHKWSSVCAGRTGAYRWPDDCHKFVDCWYGQGTLKSCFPKSLVFVEATGQCEWPL